MLFPTLARTTRTFLRPSASPIILPSLFLAPTVQQSRSASILGNLQNLDSSYSKRIRRGRGASSGKGKTSGRGHKGQKQHGKVPAGFNGGQTPLEVVHGKRGFENFFSVEMSPLNLGTLQSWIDQGRIDPTKPITFKELVDSRCIHGIKDGVKLLARGKETFKTPINITVSRASSEAIKYIEAAGGKVETRFFNKNGIKSILYPHLYEFQPRLANATARKDIEYYRDPAHRGYLSHTVAEGESPSLFFKAPRKEGEVVKRTGKKKQTKGANRLF
ncbi:YmL10 [Rhizina undulata]